MDINFWVIFDTLLLLVNIYYVARKVRSFKDDSSFFVGLSIFSLVLIFIFPLGLMPVGVLPMVELNAVPRNWFWHLKVGPVAIGDLSLLLYFLVCLFNLIRVGRVSRYILVACVLVIGIFFSGVLSAFYTSNSVDYQNILNSARSFLIILLFLYSGNFVVSRCGQAGIVLLSECLWWTFVISLVSMSLLSPSFRAIRYFVPAMLQSQQYVSVIPFLFLYFFVKRGESDTCHRHYRLWGIGTVMLLFMGYKAFYLLLVLFLIIYVISRLKLMPKKMGTILFLIFAVMVQPLVLYLNFIFEGFSSIDTRAFQVANAMKTLQDRGLVSMIFGIGWGQWYTVYFDFPMVDYGAWTDRQLMTDLEKYSIQMSPFSLVRSIGLGGFAVAFFSTMLYVWKLCSVKMSRADDKLIICGMIAVNVATFFTLPDVLPETAGFAAFFCGAMLAVKDAHEKIA